MAAHDLRNRLFVVQSCAKFLLAKASGQIDEEQVEFLSIIQSYSGFMLQMVEDLLDVSAIFPMRSSSPPPGSQVEISLKAKVDRVVISVRDEGQGIPAEELDRLFQWFGRTSVRGTEGERSTGLGLAIARRIVLGHGGRIWVESEVGKDSTFYVALSTQSEQVFDH